MPTLTIKGLDHEFLQGPMHRALANGSLDTGHMDVGLTPGQSARSVKIPWVVLVSMDSYWRRKEHDWPGEFIIDGAPSTGRIKGSLVSGEIRIEY